MNKIPLKISYLIVALIFLFSVIFSICYNKYSIIASKTLDNSFTVIIDAGHGGEDGGAVAPDGSLEKDFNLDIALKLEKILKLYGFRVIMTRTEDKMTCDIGLSTQRQKKVSDIRNRMKLMTSYKNAVFISIHQNNFSDPDQHGTQVFYAPSVFTSQNLADFIQRSIVNNLQKDNKRKTKKSGTEIYLLYHSTIPAVLVECGFLSNKNDLNLLKTESYRTKIATLIADGLLNFYIQR